MQKSGYFARSAAANDEDLRADQVDDRTGGRLRAARRVRRGRSRRGATAIELRAIEFDRIKGGKKFEVTTPWFIDLLAGIGQRTR